METRKKKKMKTQGKSRCESGVQNGDRISSLPDSILHHILSFIPTIYAVHTCVLSKRWRYIWTGIPKLDLGEGELNTIFFDKINFLSFAETVILLHDSTNINEFRLYRTSGNNFTQTPRVEALISTILRNNIQKLEIYLDEHSAIDFPSGLYTCASLAMMKIDAWNSRLKLPASVSFPNLKLLHLEGFTVQCEEGIKQVSFSCPVLKELMLNDVSYGSTYTICIFAPKLETVELQIEEMLNQMPNESPNFANGSKLKIYAPNILTLNVIDGSSQLLSLRNLSPLPNACIVIRLGTLPNLVSKLSKSISNVKEVTVSLDAIPYLSTQKGLDLFALSNLNKVIVTGCLYTDLTAESLVGFLCSLSNIESLIFTNGLAVDSNESYNWTLAEIPQSFLSHLKSFEIRGFDGDEFEVSLVEFVLKNARSIEKMSIFPSRPLSQNFKKQTEVMKRFLLLGKASISFS